MTANVMLDIETLSTRYNAAIVQIGAVKFIPDTGEIIDEFLVNISMKDCIAKGLDVDSDTIKWWNKQNPEAVKSFLINPLLLEEALHEFSSWYGKESMLTFCNGMNFDFPILSNAFDICKMTPPWKYWNLCDYRTVVNLSGLPKSYFDQQRIEMGTLYHCALDDCKFQTKMLHKLLS